MREAMNRLFNWKRHPASVFFIAGPLALICFGAILARAVIELVQNGDPWYLVITAVGIAMFVMALWPIRHRLKEALNG